MKLSEERPLPTVLSAIIAILLSLSLFVVLTSRNGTPIGIYDNGIGDRWPPGHRALIVVDRTSDASWNQSVAAAVSTWREGGSALRLVLTAAGGACRQQRDHIEVCQATRAAIAAQGTQGEQGIFEPFVGRNHDYRSAVLLVCSDCGIDKDRMTVIATHELGHALGLAHNPNPESVMYYLGGSTQPDARDYQALHLLEGTADQNP